MNTPRRSGGDTLSVRFLRTWQTYMAGDVATFPEHMARGLVARRVAEPVNWAKPGETPPDDDWRWGLRPPGPAPVTRDG